MKKRILSFLLALVMVVLALPVFVLSTGAVEVATEYSSKWLDNEPFVTITEGVGTVTFPSTAWSIGYKSDAATLVPFGKYSSGGGADAKLISSTGEDQWGNGGYYSVSYGASMQNVAIVAGKYVAYRYTAEYTGTATLSVNALHMLACDNNHQPTGVANSAFAIAVNGEVKWPEGATYDDKATWYYDADKEGNIAADIDDVTVHLQKGDAVEFLFARVSSYSWSHYSFDPVVTYNTTEVTAPELPYKTEWINAYPTVANGTVTYPTDAWAVGYKTLGKDNFFAFDAVAGDLIRANGSYEWTQGGMFYNGKNVGGSWYAGGVLIAGSKAHASSYRYVAEYTGTATLSADNLVFIDAEVKTGVANAAMIVTLNGEVLWPAGAKANDISTWYYAGDKINVNLAAELGEITVALKKGDWVEFQFANVNSGWATNDFKPVVTYTEIDAIDEYTVTYVDENNTVLMRYTVPAGSAFPVCPVNARWDVNGDKQADELPATVLKNTTVKLVSRPTQTSSSFNPSLVNGMVVSSSIAGWDTVIIQSPNSTLPAKNAVRHVPDSKSTAGGFTWAYPSTLCAGAGPNDDNPGFILSGSDGWYPNGSAIASWKYTAGWRYTATYDGVADVTVDYLKNVGQWAKPDVNSQFVILKNGEKIWPTDSNWYVFNTKDENMAETIMASAASVLTGISLKEGDTLEFLTSDAANAWGNQFAGSFTVSYREAPSTGATVKDASVALGEQFAAIYSVDAPADATNVGVNVNGKFYAADENGKVALPAVAAKNIVDSQTATTVYTDAKGYVWYGASYTYSVADLLMQYVNGADEKAADLAIATLNYAAAAQAFFGYNTFDLANAALTDEQKAVAPMGTYSDGHGITPVKEENRVATLYGVKLILNDTVDVAVYFKSDVDLTADNYSVSVSDGEQSTQIGDIVPVGDGLYKAIIPRFMPTSWGTEYTFTLYNSENSKFSSDMLSYSITDYCVRMQNSDASAVVNAMLALYEAADAYN